MSKGKPRRDQGQGRVYNLRRILRRLNGLYFGGAVKARVEWGRGRGQRSLRSREFGTYYYRERLIRIHPVLDQAWVPLYVVESVLHHEMCHQVCPEQIVNGRRRAHTAEFRRCERQYLHYHEAEQWMRENLSRLLAPAPILDINRPIAISQQLNLALAV